MVDGVERFLPEDGEHAGGQSTDHKRAHETGGMGDGDGVEVIFVEIGIAEGLMDDGKDGFEVGTGGDFWYNSAISRKNVNLRNHDIAEDFGAVFNHGGGSFITRSFNGEDFHRFIIPCMGDLGQGRGMRENFCEKAGFLSVNIGGGCGRIEG